MRVIRDQEGESRGYGFVEFDNKEDFVTAYKNANYRKIDGHKIIVDYERGSFSPIQVARLSDGDPADLAEEKDTSD